MLKNPKYSRVIRRLFKLGSRPFTVQRKSGEIITVSFLPAGHFSFAFITVETYSGEIFRVYMYMNAVCMQCYSIDRYL